MTELRRRMIEDMRLHALSEATQRTYIDAVANLARYFKRSPDQVTEEELRRFFVSLTRRRAKSTVRVHLFAIRFLYRYTLRRPSSTLDLIRVKRDRGLPAVLSHEEVRQLLAHIRRPEARMAALLMYSCGLRVSQAIHLKVADVDSRRMALCVRHGKGGQQQYVLLPQRTLELLRAYWLEHRPSHWLLPDQTGRSPIRREAVLKAIVPAAQEAHLTKHVSCHTLRHSYATGLLEDGMDIRFIQGLLGHHSIRSTAAYAHLTSGTLKNVQAAVNARMANL
jgi:site-specific recombinase XerD